MRSVTNTWTPTVLSGTRTLVELSQSVVAGHDLDGTAYPTVTTGYTYDAYANPTQIARAVSDGSSDTQTNTFTNDAVNWILGQPLTSNDESIVGSSDLTRHMSFTTDPATGLVTAAIIEPSSGTLELETDYGYDAFGNVTGITQSGPGITTRTTTIVFDSKGEFVHNTYNALSQSDSFLFDARFGTLTRHNDINLQDTFLYYDTFGRLTKVIRPDTTQTQLTYTYCSGIGGGTATCPTYGAYVVEGIPYAPDGTTVIGPYSMVKYDMLSRPQLAATQGFSGGEIDQETVYDALLHVYQTSRPAFAGAGYHLTTYSYDALDRVTQSLFPDGSKTTYGYDALTSTVTNDKSQVTTALRNAQGLVASVTDAAGKTTHYVYDAFGDATTITDPNGNAIANVFDIRGRKTNSSDPDMGSWSYAYDPLSELTSQTDARSQMTTLTYDLLGRPLSRVEVGLTSSWTWDTRPHGVGELASACTAASCTGASYVRTPSYDSTGRPTTETLQIDGTSYSYHQAYDTNGRLASVTYPSGFKADYAYTSLSYLSQIDDDATSAVLWTANTANAEMQLTQETAGNGVVTTRGFDANTGRVQTIQAGTGNDVQNASFAYDTLGNVTVREWSKTATTRGRENACYDSLNRMTSSYVITGSNACTGSGAVTVGYDALGNISSKSDVGSYTYSGSGAGPHAVTSITGTVNGVVNPTYIYDADGNMTAGAGRTLTWTSFNMVASIVDGSASLALTYDSEHNRIKQCVPTCTTPTATTDYLNDPATGSMEETYVTGGTTTWRDYIKAGGNIVALRSNTSGTVSLLYFVSDHLGSISSITDSTGALISGGLQSYDPWGLRRNTSGTPASCGAIASATTRGFTAQEMMDAVCFINLNGRIYDPTIGRVVSADPMVPNPANGQSFNRYSYVNNGPLSATDPTGYVHQNTTAPPVWTDPGCIVCGDQDNDPAALLSGSGGAGWFGLASGTGNGVSAKSSSGYYQMGPGPDVYFPTGLPNEEVTVTLTWMTADPFSSPGTDLGGGLSEGEGCGEICGSTITAGALILGGLPLLDLVSNFLPTRGTLQVGIGASGAYKIPGTTFGVGYAGSLGITVDTHFNVGGYVTGGFGGASGELGGAEIAGGTVQISNAATIDDLAGPFANLSINGGDLIGGSLDAFAGNSPDGPVVGGGFTAGEGEGLSGSVMPTKTYIFSTNGGFH